MYLQSNIRFAMLVAALVLTALTARSEAHVSWADQPLSHSHLGERGFPNDQVFYFAPLSPLSRLVDFARTYLLPSDNSINSYHGSPELAECAENVFPTSVSLKENNPYPDGAAAVDSLCYQMASF